MLKIIKTEIKLEIKDKHAYPYQLVYNYFPWVLEAKKQKMGGRSVAQTHYRHSHSEQPMTDTNPIKLQEGGEEETTELGEY